MGPLILYCILGIAFVLWMAFFVWITWDSKPYDGTMNVVAVSVPVMLLFIFFSLLFSYFVCWLLGVEI